MASPAGILLSAHVPGHCAFRWFTRCSIRDSLSTCGPPGSGECMIDRRIARTGPQERPAASGTCVIPEARVAVKFLAAGRSMSFWGLNQAIRSYYQEEANAH